jgi:inhibitor of cysteine peptidase
MLRKAKYMAVLALFLWCILVLSACSKASADSKPDNRIKAGEIFTVTLDENITTGYSWSYTIDNKNVIQFDSDSTSVPKTDAAGAGGTHTWNFKAVGKGTVTIVFDYKRPWEKDKRPIDTKVYTITVE